MLDAPQIMPLGQIGDRADMFGDRAVRLDRLVTLGLPVPDGVVLSVEAARLIGTDDAIPEFDDLDGLISLRSSPGQAHWGGPSAILNIGITDAHLPKLAAQIGEKSAWEVYRRFIQSYAVRVEGLDPEDFENLYYDELKVADAPSLSALKSLVSTGMQFFEDEVGHPFPQDPRVQINGALRAMITAWNSASAKILRQARGAPEDAGLGLILQRMVFGLGDAAGAGHIQFIDEASGAPRISGRYLPDAQGQDALMGVRTPHLLTVEERETAGQVLPSLEEIAPSALERLKEANDAISQAFGDAIQIGFTVAADGLHLLDALPARRSAPAAVRVAVDLAEAGIITRQTAILRIDPLSLTENLHPQIDPTARRDVIGVGLPASPGAATGKIVFSPAEAVARHAQDEACILVRTETSPEDIRGMHAAAGVLTVRGGMTSHAAVIARGLGLPCVVGAGDLRLDVSKRQLKTHDGRIFIEGDVITVDGSSGHALNGAPRTRPAELTDAFLTLMDWADDFRTMGVRANADTPADARVAQAFGAEGIGLCRTEHMFFDDDRITVMREMILAASPDRRQNALDRLRPMQRDDFVALFRIMEGIPVTIRLLDPPLHEFLPHSEDEMSGLAEAFGVSVEQIIERARDLREFNPMLGKRGVRLGITMPEIYDMQARAIFEAVVEIARDGTTPPRPEVMIPLVSANREAELVKSRVDAIARDVRAESGIDLDYRIGVMIETPRGALRSGDLARSSAFLSYGTNDLTQMTYGLSRDDAGRFMRDYVGLGVFAEDPFHSLDTEGVGELVRLSVARARQVAPDIDLGLCGEHGGDPASIRFCQSCGIKYVSCSPFRVPIARLAAAQAALLANSDVAPVDK